MPFLPFFKAAYKYHFIESDAGSERHEGEKTLTKLLFQREPCMDCGENHLDFACVGSRDGKSESYVHQ